MSLLEAYIDESGSHEGSSVLCVAGYLYTKDNRLKLDKEWGIALQRFNLPYFHMVDCAHGNLPFDKLSKTNRTAVAKEMIELIKKYMLYGFSVTINETQYDLWRKDKYQLFGSAYTFCCWMMLIAVESWAEKHAYGGKIAYYFEAGHKHQSEANKVLTETVDLPEFRYASHNFVEKKFNGAIQSADLLAWQAAKFRKDYLVRPPRQDFFSLVARDTVTFNAEKSRFDDLFERL